MSKRYRFTFATFLVLVLAAGLLFLAALLILVRWAEVEDTIAADASVVSVESRRERHQGIRGSIEVTWAVVRYSLPDGRIVSATVRPAPEAAVNGAKTVRIRYKRDNPRIVTNDSGLRYYLGAAALLSFSILSLVLAHFVALRDGFAQRGAPPAPKTPGH